MPSAHSFAVGNRWRSRSICAVEHQPAHATARGPCLLQPCRCNGYERASRKRRRRECQRRRGSRTSGFAFCWRFASAGGETVRKFVHPTRRLAVAEAVSLRTICSPCRQPRKRPKMNCGCCCCRLGWRRGSSGKVEAEEWMRAVRSAGGQPTIDLTLRSERNSLAAWAGGGDRFAGADCGNSGRT